MNTPIALQLSGKRKKGSESGRLLLGFLGHICAREEAYIFDVHRGKYRTTVAVSFEDGDSGVTDREEKHRMSDITAIYLRGLSANVDTTPQ